MHSLAYKLAHLKNSRHAQNNWNIIRKFQTTKEVADLPPTGRPRCMRTPKKIKAIREGVRRNPKSMLNWACLYRIHEMSVTLYAWECIFKIVFRKPIETYF